PGRLGIVLAQVAFAALDKAQGDLMQQIPRPLMSLSRGLAEQTMGLFEAAVFQRLLGLSNCQPAGSEHGFRFILIPDRPALTSCRIRPGPPNKERPPHA